MAVKFHVIYHSPCPDGCFAALAASMWFSRNSVDPLGEQVVWKPMEVFKPACAQFDVTSVSIQDEVFLLDYTGGPEFVLSLASKCQRCTVIDHHQTALTQLQLALKTIDPPGSLKLVLDMHRSGATMALDYFSSRPFPTDTIATKVETTASTEVAVKKQRLAVASEWTSDYNCMFSDEAEAKRLLKVFRFIEDADLWRWWLQGSREFAAGFAELKLNMDPRKSPSLFATLRSLQPEVLQASGAAVLAKTQSIISAELDRTFELLIPEVGGIRCLGVITEHGGLRSSMGNEIAIKSRSLGLQGFGCVIYFADGIPEGKVKFSVRALDGENSLKITECFGGGGHKGASSCNVDTKLLETWKVASDEVPRPVPGAFRCTKGFLMDAYRCACCASVESA